MTPTWQITGPIATLALDRWSTVVDARRPAIGLHKIVAQDRSLPRAAVLGPAVVPSGSAATSAEFQAQESRLIVTYPAIESNSFAVRLCWDAGRFGHDGLRVDLTITVWTEALQCHPEVVVRTTLEGDEWKAPGPKLAATKIIRLSDSPLAYLEMLHPTTEGRTMISRNRPSGEAVWEHHLFPGELEKGVTLRGCLRGVFCPDSPDGEWPRLAAEEFAAVPPPLN